MDKTLNSGLRKFRVRPSSIPRPDTKEITALEDIPEFDDVEAEIKFWKHHTVSEAVLDQIPEPEELE